MTSSSVSIPDLGAHRASYPARLPRWGGKARRFAGARLDFYAKGVVVSGAEGKRYAFAWATTRIVQAITDLKTSTGRVDKTFYSYVLAAPDGTAVYLGSSGPGSMGRHLGVAEIIKAGQFEEPEVWGPALQRGVTEAQLDSAVNDIRDGRTLTFGSWTLSREGIGFKGQIIAWPRVQGVGLAVGYLIVRADGKRRPVAKEQYLIIPNVFLLRELALRFIEGSLK